MTQRNELYFRRGPHSTGYKPVPHKRGPCLRPRRRTRTSLMATQTRANPPTGVVRDDYVLSDEFNLTRREGAHSQEDQTVAEAGDVGVAIGAGFVVNGNIDDL